MCCSPRVFVALAVAVAFAIRAALLGVRARRFHKELERITSGAVAPAEIPAALDGLVDGVRYKQRGFEIDKEGTLLVTSKRLLLVQRGTSSVRLDNILDVTSMPTVASSP